MRGDLQISIHVDVTDRLFLFLGEVFGVLVLLFLREIVDVLDEPDDCIAVIRVEISVDTVIG
ncbi:dehydrogenase of unknown specificity, short- chain alcohol dehydrogenase like protein [Halogeometricum borinquense DSM 11551]|uniref:Uncharacterized protein n=1 Tax=Halogeometricum borinquense (strain ATCC 700274 / DSM 11551 / JCM 10706 / KCTC 4070 / PR3) TaxID=469382 RepID=E4NW01_HALBP|nr:hypothetical protein [Halogeometricum borinquense]ADQ69221.1 dehydrogenase of unknown specificity, short- chain alcohol dehydrogenase like protein [Halogeometricum borinquense DSM 11551]ELY31522.1 dehydrogenase of unknown specificity, short- chain alcohol dehydrogenase like protein [Halogeometricum borinquense DSM 11551]